MTRFGAIPSSNDFETDVAAVVDDNMAYYQYIYNSSGAQAGNRYNSWSDLQTAIGGREARVQFEQNETIPAGAWDIDYQIWVGNGQNPFGGAVVVTFPTGVTLSSAINWNCVNGLELYSTSTSPIYTMTVPHILFFDRTAIYTDTVEFIKVTCNGLVAVGCINGFGMYNNGAGAGNYEVINVDSSAYGTILVTTEQGTSPVIEPNTVRCAVPIIYGWLKQSSEANTPFATHANLDPGSINFAGVPLGSGNAFFSNAEVTGFPSGQPTGITSNNVADALAELAAVRLRRTTTAADPTTTELPSDTDASIHKNTTSGNVFLAYNDGGSIVKVQLV